MSTTGARIRFKLADDGEASYEGTITQDMSATSFPRPLEVTTSNETFYIRHEWIIEGIATVPWFGPKPVPGSDRARFWEAVEVHGPCFCVELCDDECALCQHLDGELPCPMIDVDALDRKDLWRMRWLIALAIVEKVDGTEEDRLNPSGDGSAYYGNEREGER